MKSGGVVRAVTHEAYQILPLEVSTDANVNDRRRSGQCYPGSVSRKFWELMQSSSTRDGMLINTN